jgi:hypothetical protein
MPNFQLPRLAIGTWVLGVGRSLISGFSHEVHEEHEDRKFDERETPRRCGATPARLRLRWIARRSGLHDEID